MTKKDYELIARAINYATHATTRDEVSENIVWGADWIAYYLHLEDPKFNTEKFLKIVTSE